ncbi:hypothetical protein IC803_03050 [Geobacillus sp. 46C-IIa]|uniref:hypothetical protein n=1 Tax=Geobacillus sp. 46C-IIa TaxID=1963025 RepID=UPI00117BD47D|nr:hypothetical protein [Geobacillus sp. 46C-IIa]QNU28547.1 hypothetical protein IC803_03050 [Geobacillus sp. 46C-IIa]
MKKQLKAGLSQAEKLCKISSSFPTNSIDPAEIIVFHQSSRKDGKGSGHAAMHGILFLRARLLL